MKICRRYVFASLLTCWLSPAMRGQSSPTAIAQSFAKAACANGAPCLVQIPPTYPFNAERAANPDLPSTVPGINQHLIDYRMGAEIHTFSDTSAVASYLPADSLAANCLSQRQTYEANCLKITHFVNSPGYNLGNAADPNQAQGWFVTHGLLLNVGAAAAGITAGVDMFLNKYGIGDVHNYSYVHGEGGFRGASDEMLQGRALTVGEMDGPTYTGTVTSTSAFKVITTPVTGSRTQGVGRMLIDTSAPVASGCVTAQGQLADSGGAALPVSTFTLGCGAVALTPTTAWGRLNADAHATPNIPSTGSNTVATSTALSIKLSAGAFKVGDLAVFAGDYHETATVLAVQPPVAGVQLVTFGLRRTHSAGSVVMQSSFGAGGLEFLANDGDGLRYSLDVLGAISATQIAAVAFRGAASTVVNAYNVLLQPFYATDTITNTGGVVTIPFRYGDIGNNPQLQNYPLITISGAANAVFNGPCLNLHQVAAAASQCTQASSTGQTSSTGTITLGDTGYGNSRFLLWASAEVLDVQDYSTVPITVNGAFRLEPNALRLAVGDTVEEPHDYAAGYVASAVGFGYSNIYAAQYSSIEDPGVGGAGINGSVYARYTKFSNPCSMYVGCGGNLSAPHGYQIGGMAASFGGMDRAPWPSGSAFLKAGCDPQTGDCTNPLYHYPLFFGQGLQPAAVNGSYPRDHGLTLDFNPYSGRYDTSATHTTFSQIASTSSPVSGACFINDSQTGLAIELASCPLSAGAGIADAQSTTPTSGNPIAASSCGAAVTVTMANMLTTSVFTARPSTDVSGTAGWTPSDAVYIQTWPTTGYGNYKLCNRGSSPASPAAIVLNLGAQ